MREMIWTLFLGMIWTLFFLIVIGSAIGFVVYYWPLIFRVVGRLKRLGLQILILVILPGLFLSILGGVVYGLSGNMLRAFLVPAFLVSVLGFGVIWPLKRFGGFIVLRDMTAASVTFLNQHRRIIMSASLRRGDWNLLGGLRIIGIPGLHRLREFTTTRVVEVTSEGEVKLKSTTETILSLQDQAVDLVFKDPMAENQIQMEVRIRMFFRVDIESDANAWNEGPQKVIYAAEDWASIVVQRMRPIVRQVISKHDWPAMNTQRAEIMAEITDEMQRDTRPSMLPGGAPDDSSTVKFILKEYGIHIQALEPGIILPTDQDVKDAGETAYKREQELAGLKKLSDAYAGTDGANLRTAKEYDILTDMSRNNQNINIGGMLQEIAVRAFGRR